LIVSSMKQFIMTLKRSSKLYPIQDFLIWVLQVVPAMKDGLVADWDVVESLWDHALRYSCDTRLSRVDYTFFTSFFIAKSTVEYSGFLVCSLLDLRRFSASACYFPNCSKSYQSVLYLLLATSSDCPFLLLLLIRKQSWAMYPCLSF